MKAQVKKIIEFWLFTQRWAGSVVGPLFMILATMWSFTTFNFLHHSQKANATIVELATHPDGEDGLDYYAPVFQFAAADGTNHTVESGIRSRPAGFIVGQSVPIRYLSETPDDAKIETFMQLWFFPLTFGICGLLATIFAVWLWVRYFKKKTQQAATQNFINSSSFNS